MPWRGRRYHPRVPTEGGVVLSLPGMEAARVRKDLPFGSGNLAADLYAPAADGPARPAVIFISGDAPPEYMEHLKESPQYVSWGQLAAASGLMGVTFDHSSTLGLREAPKVANEIDALRAFVRERGPGLGIDPHRVAIWICSGGPPFGLRSILRDGDPDVRCIAVYYGRMDLRLLRAQVPPEVPDSFLDEFSAATHLRAGAPPLLLARAGRDQPEINELMDGFLRRALELNLEVTAHNHPTGQHAFDVRDDDARSREIIAATLAFFVHHLGESAPV